MTYFTDSIFEKMMMQKPRYGQGRKAPAPAIPAKAKSQEKEQKVRKLMIIQEHTGAKKQDKEDK